MPTSALTSRDDQRGFQPDSQRFQTGQQPADQSPGLIQRFPVRSGFRPVPQSPEQFIHLSEQFELSEFCIRHDQSCS